MISSQHPYTVSMMCQSYAVSRQAYYQHANRQQRGEVIDQQVLELVRQRRQQLAFEGVRKLMHHLEPLLQERGINIGRDRLYKLLGQHNLLIRRKKRKTLTTNSNHPFYVHRNLIQGWSPTANHQLWVADITYLRTTNKFIYLALITDAYSRKIIGYDLSDSLELTGCKRALHMALKQLPRGYRPIHHSDRGIQYCSYAYTDTLKQHRIRISMADTGDCYQNALAERINGILKEEFLLDHIFRNKQDAVKATKQAIKTYNNVRLHLKLNFKTPEQIHKNPN